MSTSNGKHGVTAPWGYAVEGKPPLMLLLACAALQRDGAGLVELPGCNEKACSWVRQVAECLQRGECRGAVLFCADGGLACCVGNKVRGVRAVPAWTVPQAERAVLGLGANLLVVETAGRTFFEFKQFLRLGAQAQAACPPGVACVLQELDGHAHR